MNTRADATIVSATLPPEVYGSRDESAPPHEQTQNRTEEGPNVHMGMGGRFPHGGHEKQPTRKGEEIRDIDRARGHA